MLASSPSGICIVLAALGLLLAGCTQQRAEQSAASGSGGSESKAAASPRELAGPPLDAALLSERLGAAVTAGEGGALRAEVPRAELSVMVDGAPVPRALALGTSVEFRPAPGGARVSGQVALLEDEVSPALDTLLAHGIQVVGLHQRFSFDEPRVLSLRFTAEGNAASLASGVQSLGAAIRDARLRSPEPLRSLPGEAPTPGKLDAGVLGGALGLTASEQGGEVLVKLAAWPGGSESPARVSSEPVLRAVWIGSDLHAALEGSLVLTRAELSPVLGALRRANLHLSALAPDGAGQTPAHFFVHFRGRGSSLELVQALRGVLDARVVPG